MVLWCDCYLFRRQDFRFFSGRRAVFVVDPVVGCIEFVVARVLETRYTFCVMSSSRGDEYPTGRYS